MRQPLAAACAVRLKTLAEKPIQRAVGKPKPGKTDMAQRVLERERGLQTDASAHALRPRKRNEQSRDELDPFANFAPRPNFREVFWRGRGFVLVCGDLRLNCRHVK